MKFLFEHWGLNFQPGDPVEQHDGSYRVPVHLQVRLENVAELVVPKGGKGSVQAPSYASVNDFMLRKLFPHQAKELAAGKGFTFPISTKANVIEQLQAWCRAFLEEECDWVRRGRLPIETFMGIQRIVEEFQKQLIGFACRCPRCDELGFNSEWNKNTRGYDRWCDHCGYKAFEPEM